MSTVPAARTNWFENFFHGVANEMWRRAVSPEQTRIEADYIAKTLGTRGRLLDVPCGSGRLAIELARRGARVTGVDISSEFIAEAKATQVEGKGRAEFQVDDMRYLRWKARFDGAFCFGNAFGYFEYPDMVRFVRGVAAALRPGGKFLVQTFMAAESQLPKLPEREWYPVGDIHFAVENHYLAEESCLETKCTFIQGGKTETRTFWHHVYTVAEMRRLLEAAGLRVIKLSGSYTGEPFAVGQHMLLILAVRSAK